mgnify:CR=1 FL=1
MADVGFSARVVNGGRNIKFCFHWFFKKTADTAVFSVLFVFEAVFLIESIDAAIGLS